MNLILDKWIEVARRSGRRERIAPLQLTAEDGDPVAEVLAPRPDFRGALYQFLIALLQTACAPEDLGEWKDRWEEPMNEAQLEQALAPYIAAFELDGDGPAFMQDYDSVETKPIGIAGLLINAPGKKTAKDNNDHFIHQGGVTRVCPQCAATALLTLQINAPSGGAGHRVSVRGGGPLTTLRIPQDADATLWHKLWMNVLPRNALPYDENPRLSDVLPWMAPTRTSDPKGVGDTTPETVHPLQAYWSMPRRIRLDFADVAAGVCDLCGEPSKRLVHRYRTHIHGVNYTGAWLYPLTPYSYDPKGEQSPWSIKGEKGRTGYQHWLGLTMGNDTKEPAAAAVVAYFISCSDRLPVSARDAPLWCYGYDMDKMKARCWYDSTLPMHVIAPESVDDLVHVVKSLIDVASEAAELLHKQVIKAWFTPPKKGQPAGKRKEEPAVQLGFWQASETQFYALLDKVAKADLKDNTQLAPLYGKWLRVVRDVAMSQFDAWVLAAPIEGMEMKRVVKAQAELGKFLKSGKAAKALWQIVNTNQKEQA
jgi:CRISPR system Cascade subunit CasA